MIKNTIAKKLGGLMIKSLKKLYMFLLKLSLVIAGLFFVVMFLFILVEQNSISKKQPQDYDYKHLWESNKDAELAWEIEKKISHVYHPPKTFQEFENIYKFDDVKYVCKASSKGEKLFRQALEEIDYKYHNYKILFKRLDNETYGNRKLFFLIRNDGSNFPLFVSVDNIDMRGKYRFIDNETSCSVVEGNEVTFTVKSRGEQKK